MARTKQEYQAPTPLNLDGEGIETVTVKHFFKRGKRDKTTKELLPGETDIIDTFQMKLPVLGKLAGKGIVTFQKAMNDAGKNGNDAVANALRNALVDAQKNARKTAHEEKQALPENNILPEFPGVRLTDENEATADQILSGLKSGKISTDDPEIRALFAKLAK
jgi:Sec-independent protein translocase protein TatA